MSHPYAGLYIEPRYFNRYPPACECPIQIKTTQSQISDQTRDFSDIARTTARFGPWSWKTTSIGSKLYAVLMFADERDAVMFKMTYTG